MGKLLEVQRQADIYTRLLNPAPGLDIYRPDDGELARWLLSFELRATTPILLREPLALEVVKEYPLDSPQMLNAAKAHGVDEQILRAVHEGWG